MKSKMPCPPAFIPVMTFDHATGLCGGMLVVNFLNEPSCASLAKFGILPSAMNLVRRPGSMPSTPSTISFLSLSPSPRARVQETREIIPKQASTLAEIHANFFKPPPFRRSHLTISLYRQHPDREPCHRTSHSNRRRWESRTQAEVICPG